MLFKV